MTDLVDAPNTTDTPAAEAPLVEQVADTFVGLMHSFGKARARLLAAARHDVEWSAHVILRAVQNEGPMRASAIAEAIQSDPSTVSRQVAALVKDGMLERQADPEDGRAALLVLTARAHEVLGAQHRVRLDYFARMLADWSPSELHDFAGLLRRFTTDYENANELWMSERLLQAAARPGGTN
ncbi:MarR family winged helix-turn-helix transcriptional regulator [uncultured Jatrophihabitans sp.]|uniref:MarR family winged helix-turn-helix transcriptional regulator n=1 Tax=uncultured Jatrophihabitans sp. TaxID=1610747 RepID=UPI0035CC52B2